MFKRITTLLIASCNIIFAQVPDLYVNDNSYLYAKDVVVFVNDDIQLETATSNLYFRGDAQLIQNTDTKNSDLGELSIYQAQTTGIYEYNYFCSPVGVSVNGTTKANVPFDGSNIHDPVDDTDIENINSIPYLFTTAFNGTATQLSNYWLYTLIDAEGYYGWNQIFDTGSAGIGYGFTLKGSPNTNNVLDFRGRPNNGTITVSCAFDGIDDDPSGTPNTAETLTGNPYPSALDLKLFLTDGFGLFDSLGNSVATGTDNRNVLNGEIYFWEQKVKNSHYLADYEGGYGVYGVGDPANLSDNGTYARATFESYNGDGTDNVNTSGQSTLYDVKNKRFAGIGQGFVIQSAPQVSPGVSSGGNATFTNSMRVYMPEVSTPGGDGSIFSKSGGKLKTSNTKKAVIAMSHNGLDYQDIISNPTIIPEIRIHTHINNLYYKENVIAFRENTPDNTTYNKFYDGSNINELRDDAYLMSKGKALSIKSINYDEATRIPLVLKASTDNTTFDVKINSLKDVPKNVNIYVFDNETNIYTDIKDSTFSMTLNAGVYNERFEVTFAKNTLNVADVINIDDFKIFQNNTISELKLLNLNNLNIKSISVFDVSGKQVLSDVIVSNKSKHTYSTKSFSDGVYVVSINLENKIISKKIIISNKN